MTTRAEHIRWCKKRALEYLPGQPRGAINSMLSDLGKHEDTVGMQRLAFLLSMAIEMTPEAVRKWVEGFTE